MESQPISEEDAAIKQTPEYFNKVLSILFKLTGGDGLSFETIKSLFPEGTKFQTKEKTKNIKQVNDQNLQQVKSNIAILKQSKEDKNISKKIDEARKQALGKIKKAQVDKLKAEQAENLKKADENRIDILAQPEEEVKQVPKSPPKLVEQQKLKTPSQSSKGKQQQKSSPPKPIEEEEEKIPYHPTYEAIKEVGSSLKQGFQSLFSKPKQAQQQVLEDAKIKTGKFESNKSGTSIYQDALDENEEFEKGSIKSRQSQQRKVSAYGGAAGGNNGGFIIDNLDPNNVGQNQQNIGNPTSVRVQVDQGRQQAQYDLTIKERIAAMVNRKIAQVRQMNDIPDDDKRLFIAKLKEESAKLFKAAVVSEQIEQQVEGNLEAQAQAVQARGTINNDAADQAVVRNENSIIDYRDQSLLSENKGMSSLVLNDKFKLILNGIAGQSNLTSEQEQLLINANGDEQMLLTNIVGQSNISEQIKAGSSIRLDPNFPGSEKSYSQEQYNQLFNELADIDDRKPVGRKRAQSEMAGRAGMDSIMLFDRSILKQPNGKDQAIQTPPEISLANLTKYLLQSADFISKISGPITGAFLKIYQKQTKVHQIPIEYKETTNFKVRPGAMFKLRCCD